VTGRVLVIGVGSGNGPDATILEGEEVEILDRFWEAFTKTAEAQSRLIGFNIFGFDLPFLIRRSWHHELPVPAGVLSHARHWSPVFVDLMQVWGCAVYGERIKLDTVAKFFGIEGKTGSGADFARLWFGSEEEHQQAVDYAKRDIEITRQVSWKMGVVQ